MDLSELFAGVKQEKIEQVTVSGRSFHVRGMDPSRRVLFFKALQQAKTENSAIPSHVIVALGICDEEGNPPTSSAETNLQILGKLNGKDMDDAAAVVLRLSGMSKDSVENAEKNAEPAGAPVPVPAGAGTRKDRRAAAARARRVRRN